MRALRTSEVAKSVGVHPNTIRLYEEWGLLPAIPRTPSGYRQYTVQHVEQVKLIRITLHCTILGGIIRKTAYDVLRFAAEGNFDVALELAYRHLEKVKMEKAQAEIAVELLKQWTPRLSSGNSSRPLTISQVAKLLDVTVDMLRNWERNGLISVPRDPSTGYRLYGSREIDRLRIIRTLSRARYSAMSILRMMHYLDAGGNDLKHVLDTPTPEEDALTISDWWLTALSDIEQYACQMIIQVKNMAEIAPRS